MKRFGFIRCAAAVLLCLALCTAAFAATYSDVVALFEDWEQNGYPADVAGVYSTDGSADHLTIQLIGDTDGSREREIRAMLADDSGVAFEAGTYSEQMLQEINEEIVAAYLNGTDSGVYGCGIGWSNEGGFGESGKESRVVVQVDRACYDELSQLFREKYGDAVYVEISEPAETTDEEVPDQALPEQPDSAEQAMEQAQEQGQMLPAEPAEALAEESPQRSESGSGGWMLAVCIVCIAAALAIVAAVIVWNRKKDK